ncbi:hypothetical protein TNCV_2613861 [Trichonephila clavipes]|nr:hypothetical protein TNCV_2613861 [Trichonephila clavipes]
MQERLCKDLSTACTWQQVERETRYGEEDLATTGETSPNEERKEGGGEKTWSDKECGGTMDCNLVSS